MIFPNVFPPALSHSLIDTPYRRARVPNMMKKHLPENGRISVKNHTDMLIFHTAICAGASQIAIDGRREPDVLVATPSLRSGIEINTY